MGKAGLTVRREVHRHVHQNFGCIQELASVLRKHALTFLDKTQLDILNAFEAKFGIR